MKRVLTVVLSCVAGAGCASSGTAEKTGDAMQSAARQTYRGMGEAVTAPLRDLNLTRQEIPVVLLAAMDAPYQTRTISDCRSIAAEVAALDVSLGPDLDTPKNEQDRNYYRLGADEAAEATLEAVRDAAVGIVPFRSWVRQLSGAKGNEKRVKEAIYAGSVRRAFLKGIGEHRGCEAPAAPLDPAYKRARAEPEFIEDDATAQGDAAPSESEPADASAQPATATESPPAP
jgi:hypothetical protein